MSRDAGDNNSAAESGGSRVWWEAEVHRALRGMQFGSVEVIVHDSRVVQIVRTEKFRVESAAGEPRRRSDQER